MFFIIDDSIIELSKTYKLTSSEILVFSYVMNFIRNNGECNASFQTIGNNTGMSRRNVVYSLNKLVKHKLIDKKNKANGNSYTSSARIAPLTNEQIMLSSARIAPQEWKDCTTTSAKIAPNNKYINKNKLNNIKKKEIKEKRTDYFESKNINDIFNEFLDTRKKMKVPNTERAISLLVNKLSEFDDDTKIKMLENAIVNGWKSVYPLKNAVNNNLPF